MPLYDYLCGSGHEYEAALSVKDCQKRTRCPKCKKVGKKQLGFRKKEPGFTDKLYPFYDKALNKIFQTPSDRKAYMRREGFQSIENGHMTKEQERFMYNSRLGHFDPREARHAR